MKTKTCIISAVLMIMLMITPALALDHYIAQRYDVNENSVIDLSELMTACGDRNEGLITESHLNDLIYFWYSQMIIEDP